MVIGIILFLIGTIVICIYVKGAGAGLVGTILVSVGTANMIVSSNVDSPSAIDVYRGKTTLEITSVNGIPTDSVVVYKKR